MYQVGIPDIQTLRRKSSVCVDPNNRFYIGVKIHSFFEHGSAIRGNKAPLERPDASAALGEFQRASNSKSPALL